MGNEQPRSYWLVGTMGDKVWWVWHSVPPMHHHQRASHRRRHSKIHQRGRQGGRWRSAMEYTYRQVIQQASWGCRCHASLPWRQPNRMYGPPQLPYHQQWSGVRNFSGRAWSHQSSRSHKCGSLLDSQVVTFQVNRDYKCKGKRMKRYLDQVRRKVDELKGKIIQIPGGENE